MFVQNSRFLVRYNETLAYGPLMATDRRSGRWLSVLFDLHSGWSVSPLRGRMVPVHHGSVRYFCYWHGLLQTRRVGIFTLGGCRGVRSALDFARPNRATVAVRIIRLSVRRCVNGISSIRFNLDSQFP